MSASPQTKDCTHSQEITLTPKEHLFHFLQSKCFWGFICLFIHPLIHVTRAHFCEILNMHMVLPFIRELILALWWTLGILFFILFHSFSRSSTLKRSQIERRTNNLFLIMFALEIVVSITCSVGSGLWMVWTSFRIRLFQLIEEQKCWSVVFGDAKKYYIRRI